MTSEEKAVDMFKNGYNCSQSVFTACVPDEKINREMKIALASGFGAGIGRNAETCGAVSGAVMALGASLIGKKFESDAAMKAHGIILADKFVKEFKAAEKTVICRELLGRDLSIPEEDAYLREKGIYSTRCFDLVKLAVKIVEKIQKSENL